jgi:hypothetical protein
MLQHAEETTSRLSPLLRLVEGGDWKDRYCVIKGSKLFMYKKQTDDNHTQFIELLGGQTELEPYDIYDRHSFRVEALTYEKEGKSMSDNRPFVFASALDSTQGLEALKRCVHIV